MTGFRLKQLCMVGISSCFDCGECGIRVLRCGEMCIENRAVGKKSRDIRHPFGKMRTHDIPWQSINKDIQHEFMPPRAVPEEDRRSHSEWSGLLTGDRRRGGETHIAVEPLTEIGELICVGGRADDELLQRLCSCDGQEHLTSLRYVDIHRRVDFLRFLQIKWEIAADIVMEPIL